MEEKVMLLEAPKLEDISYNEFLYRRRKESGLSRRKFAKLLNISRFRYKLMENGYIKPRKRDIKKLSEYFNIDFTYYMEGLRSYPSTLNDKKYNKISNTMYHIFNKKPFRIIVGILAIISIIFTITGFILHSSLSATRLWVQEDNVKELKEKIVELGKPNFSVTKQNYPIVTKIVDLGDDNEKAINIKSSYDDKYIDLTYSEFAWFSDYRLVLSYYGYENSSIYWLVSIYNYEKAETSSLSLFLSIDGERSIIGGTDEDKAILENYLNDNDIFADFDDLILTELGLNTKFIDVLESMDATSKKLSVYTNTLFYASIVSLFISFFLSFLFGFSEVYKKDKGEGVHNFNHSDKLLLGVDPISVNIKKDIKIYPFLPETILRLIGFFFVFVGALRIILITMNVGDYSADNLTEAKELYAIQVTGMFLIFFINFDIFMKDNRIFRNIMMYPIMFIFIYLLEGYLLSTISYEESVISMVLENFTFPNPFFTATMYFLIIVFLFLTPNYITTKKRLIIYRCMALIPIFVILIAFFLSKSDIIFGFTFKNYWIKQLFVGDRFSLSILAISYLVIIFFVRLYYKKKLGEERANIYFNGNKYLFLRNLIAAVLIVIIWVFEIILSNNATLNKMGVGQSQVLIIAAPLIFFYRPHMNSRNAVSDIILVTIYGVILTFVYLLGVAVAVLFLLL